MSEKKLSRRQYIKYAGAGVAAIALAGAGCYGAGRFGILNRAPVADFEYVLLSSECQPDFEPKTSERTIRYIRPSSDEEIAFSGQCIGDHYSHAWYIDDKIVAETSDYSAKLSPGEHKIRHVIQEKGGILKLLNKSSDPDTILPPVLKEFLGVSGELQYSWIVDSRNVGTTRDYSVWLPVGERKIRLDVSDGIKGSYMEKTLTILSGQQASIDKTVTVDPAGLPEYPEKRLRIPIKGINISIGCSYDIHRWPYNPEFPPVPDDELLELLYVARNELQCDAVRLFGNENQRILRAVEIAEELSFRIIMVSPRYINADIDTATSLIVPLAEELETLRDRSVVLNVGNELTTDAHGIVPGETYNERVAWIDSNYDEFVSTRYRDRLNEALEFIAEPVRRRFKGAVTYSPRVGELVEWDRLAFDAVCLNAYYSTLWDTESRYAEMINELSRFGLPSYLTEFGYYTFEECLKYGGGGWAYLNNPGVPYYHGNKPVKYSQEAQAQAIAAIMEMLNRTRLDAIFLYALIEKKVNDIESIGMIKFSETPPWNRKESFYLYKSYQRSP